MNKTKSHLKTLILILLFVNNVSYSQNNKFNLIGNWVMTDYWGNKSDLILSVDHYVSMTINGEFIDGKQFIIKGRKNDGKKGEMKYEINFKKNPIQLDLIALKEKTEMGRILGVIKPISDNEFLMILSFNGVRNSDFSENNFEQVMNVKRKD